MQTNCPTYQLHILSAEDFQMLLLKRTFQLHLKASDYIDRCGKNTEYGDDPIMIETFLIIPM